MDPSPDSLRSATPRAHGGTLGHPGGNLLGAVYMGALTHIGNAPNLMVAAIANERRIRMPGFFGYFLWAAAILVPLFLLLTILPVAPILSAH
jgi:di/tricarboxylate transporter